MCFSPEASFTLAAALAGIGAASLAQKPARCRLAFTAMPFFFAAQQAIEGFVWLSIGEGGAPPQFLVVAYLFFAHIFWPTYTPLSVLLMETEQRRRWALFILLAVGITVSAVLGAVLIKSDYSVRIVGHSLSYATEHKFETQLIGLYMVAIAAPLFISRYRYVMALGAAVLAGSFISALVFNYASASVWCFFAAIASVFVFLHVRRRKRLEN